MEEFYIESGGLKLHAKLQMPDGSEKCPLAIVIHGLTGHMEEKQIITAADAFCECGLASLRVEMYGHGKSGGLFEDHTMFHWTVNLFDVIRYVKTLDFVTDIYLCGHSQGGLLAIMAGGLMPDVFKAIIPLSPATMIPEMIRKGRFFDERIDFNNMKDHYDFFGHHLGSDYMRVARMINVDDYIRIYDKPVFIVHGDQDEAVPLSCGRLAVEKYLSGRLAIIEGADHEYTDHTAQLKTVLKEFMNGIL